MGGVETVAAAVQADLAARLPSQNKKQREGLALLVATALDVRSVNLMELAAALPRAAERIVLEDRSRNTRENALFTRHLVTPKPGERWLLITSAWHMPRAIGCFRAVGLDLEAYPVDFRTEGDTTDYWRPFDSFLDGLGVASLVIKGWLGLVVYRLAGYTTELLPAPRPTSAMP